MDSERITRDYIDNLQILTLMAAAKNGSTTTNGNSESTFNFSNILEADNKPYHFGLDQFLASREPTVGPEPLVCAPVRSKSNGRHKSSRSSPERPESTDSTNRVPSMGFPPISPQMNSHYGKKDSADIRNYSDASDSNEGVNVYLNAEVSQSSYGSGFPILPFPYYIPKRNLFGLQSSIHVPIPPMTTHNMATEMFQAESNGGARSVPQQVVPLKHLEDVVSTKIKDHKKPRGEKKPIPDAEKDLKYYERRKRNNLAAKKSRDTKKSKDDEMARYCDANESGNAVLKTELVEANLMCKMLGLDPEVISKLLPRQ